MMTGNEMPSSSVVKRLLLIPTRKSYQDIFKRSYSVNGNVGTMHKLEGLLQQENVGMNQTIRETAIANLVPELIDLKSMPDGQVWIPNGWGTQRLRFLLEVESSGGNGMTLVSYIQGFSEYYDPSFTNQMDPNMVFHINSITNVVKMINPITNIPEVHPRSTYNVITDLQGNTTYDEVDRGDKLIRPSDVIESLSFHDMYDKQNFSSLINTTGNVSAKPNVSSRLNNDATKYISTTLNSYIKSKSISDVGNDTGDILRNASGLVTEENINSVPFIFDLHNITKIFNPSSFTLGVLGQIDPSVTIKHSNKVFFIDNNNDIALPTHQTMLDTNVTADMLQPKQETLKATTAAQSINSFMLEQLLSNISISISNNTAMNSEPIVAVTNARSFIGDNVNIVKYVNNVVNKVKTILLPKISDGNQTIVECHIESDVLGDTTVSIGLNLQPPEVFRFPTFSDSLYVPVITTTAGKETLTEDIANAFDAIQVI